MATYYCSKCRQELGYLRSLSTGPILGTVNQREKHNKHTVVDSSIPLQSIFSDPSTSVIRIEVAAALSSGAIEVDDVGRVNFLTESGEGIGVRYERGIPIEQQDLTKVVLSSNAAQIHQFPESTARLESKRCSKCGAPIFASGRGAASQAVALVGGRVNIWAR